MQARLTALAAPLRHREFRLLWLAQLASDLGDWIGRVALSIVVFERTGSAFTTALVTTVSVLPYIGLGPYLTARFSRYHRRSVLVGSDLARALLFALIALPFGVNALLALAFVAGCLTPPFQATRSAAVPTVLPRKTFGDGVALMTITAEAALLLGYAAGGGLVAVLGAQPALLANSASFLLSALFLSRLHLTDEDDRRTDRAVTVRSGIRTVLDDPFVRRYIWTYTIVGGCAVIPETLAPALIQGELGEGPTLVGLLSAAVCASIILTALVAPRSGSDTALLRSASLLALLGCGLGAGLFALELGVPGVVLPFLAVGIALTSRVPGTQVVGTRVDDIQRANVYSVALACIAAGQAFIPLGAGAVAQSIGVQHASAWFLLAATLVSAVTFLRPPRGEPSPSVRSGATTPP